MYCTRWLDTIPARVPLEDGLAVFFNILDCACINAYIIYCLTTKLKLSRRQFMLELIKELCEPKDGVGSIPPSPAVDHIVSIALPGTSGLAHQARKRIECQFVACRNKSIPFCQNCEKVCCGKHPTEKVTIVKCKNCDNCVSINLYTLYFYLINYNHKKVKKLFIKMSNTQE